MKDSIINGERMLLIFVVTFIATGFFVVKLINASPIILWSINFIIAAIVTFAVSVFIRYSEMKKTLRWQCKVLINSIFSLGNYHTITEEDNSITIEILNENEQVVGTFILEHTWDGKISIEAYHNSERYRNTFYPTENQNAIFTIMMNTLN